MTVRCPRAPAREPSSKARAAHTSVRHTPGADALLERPKVGREALEAVQNASFLWQEEGGARSFQQKKSKYCLSPGPLGRFQVDCFKVTFLRKTETAIESSRARVGASDSIFAPFLSFNSTNRGS